MNGSISISSTIAVTAVTAKDTAVQKMQQKHLIGGQFLRWRLKDGPVLFVHKLLQGNGTLKYISTEDIMEIWEPIRRAARSFNSSYGTVLFENVSRGKAKFFNT